MPFPLPPLFNPIDFALVNVGLLLTRPLLRSRKVTVILAGCTTLPSENTDIFSGLYTQSTRIYPEHVWKGANTICVLLQDVQRCESDGYVYNYANRRLVYLYGCIISERASWRKDIALGDVRIQAVDAALDLRTRRAELKADCTLLDALVQFLDAADTDILQ